MQFWIEYANKAQAAALANGRPLLAAAIAAHSAARVCAVLGGEDDEKIVTYTAKLSEAIAQAIA